MDNAEIKKRIDENNEKISALLKPDTFVLNTTVAELLRLNQELQCACLHEFTNKRCIWCGKEEG